jgi:predicted nucleic acid-binding protein
VKGYLVDTNIISELTKTSPALQVENFLRQSTDRVFVSVFSIGEIRKGIASLPAAPRLKTGSIMKSCPGSVTEFYRSRSQSQSNGACSRR